MKEMKVIRAVELVRQIRDEQARQLAGKSEAEIIAFFRRAGEAARKGVEAQRLPGGTRRTEQ